MSKNGKNIKTTNRKYRQFFKEQHIKARAFFNKLETDESLLSLFICFLSIIAIAILITNLSNNTPVNTPVDEGLQASIYESRVSFTTDSSLEDVNNGVFYIEEKKFEEITTASYSATGRANIGKKATGNILVSILFDSAETKNINSGTTFKLGSYAFVANGDYSVSYDGNYDNCIRKQHVVDTQARGCYLAVNVFITAIEPGTSYNNVNYRYADSEWTTSANLGTSLITTGQISGGTDLEATVVQQSDIESAIASLEVPSDSVLEKKLLDSIQNDEVVALDSSFEIAHSDVIVNYPAGSIIDCGNVQITSIASIMTVKRAKLIEFIKTFALSANGAEAYDIDLGSMRIEDFTESEAGYIGVLKASYIYDN